MKLRKLIPYGRQSIDEEDIQSVVDVLRSDWLTTGPKVKEFEQNISEFVGSSYCSVVANGTAALHASMYAIGIKKGDEVLVPTMSFAASANAVLYQNATPVFVDINPRTLLMDVEDLQKKINKKTKAILAVDYAGHPCHVQTISKIAKKHGLYFVVDACHSIGASDEQGCKVGSVADLTAFSFHPVKHITTGEGGAVVTSNEELFKKVKLFRNHGISTEFHDREKAGAWFYEMVDLGYNYRITDIQCALGISQLKKLPAWIQKRNEIACYYREALQNVNGLELLEVDSRVQHAYHLFVVKVKNREKVFKSLREKGIGVNVHYIPIHLHPYYQKNLSTTVGLCPFAEKAYEEILSLPIYPGLKSEEMLYVVEQLKGALL